MGLVWLYRWLYSLLINKKYLLQNLFNLAKKNGKLICSNGYALNFNEKTKKEIKKLYEFSVFYGVKFSNSKGYWRYSNEILTTPKGLKFYIYGFDPLIFAETFLYDSHFSYFDLKNKIVVQAGGYIGDTPLYFAARGAKVYCFEPDLISFKRALRNIKLNPKLSKNIVMKNYAIGNDGLIDFPVSGSGGASAYDASSATAKVRSVSISTILKEFKIKNPFLLDLDIKRKEFEVINDPAISKFSIIRIEYTTKIGDKYFGTRDFLIKKLKDYGFNEVRIFKHNEVRYDLNEHGTLECFKFQQLK